MLPIKHRKSLGQHFINDPTILDNIASIIIEKIKELTNQNLKQITILEIGSSYGILSFTLLNKLIKTNTPFDKILLNEIDYRLIKKLELKITENKTFNNLYLDKKIEIINTPFEKIDLNKFENLILIGNIPFYITGIVLRKIIDYNKKLALIILNLQKEVVDKIKSLNNAQSLILNMIYNIEYHFIIHPKYYTPQPKVFSQIISLNKKKEFDKNYINKLYKFLDKIYKNKNKKLINILTTTEIEKLKNYNVLINSILQQRAINLNNENLISIFNIINS